MNYEDRVNVVVQIENLSVQIEKCICLDCEEEDVNVNSEDRVNASTIHGISSPRLCSEECRCICDENKQNQQLSYEQNCKPKFAKSTTITKAKL